MPASPFVDSVTRYMTVRRYNKRAIEFFYTGLSILLSTIKMQHPEGMGDNNARPERSPLVS